ncbi:tetratricopeptide repeat protein [Microvirga calopogonii]|uniref:tetratricopeptide repeat protein n=1 Tax=Microvirga calopogonii TaxID=2078013 RepID=UPI000E0D613B|nr:tetratricopeptide repeat protein [Microvirga calopogonii]
MNRSTRSIGIFLWDTLRGQRALLLVIVAAVSLSLFFVPRGAELGRLNLELGLTHKALAILEENFAGGDMSAATIGALAQARARTGNVPGAVVLLEQLLSEHPRDPELLHALAGFYRQLGHLEASLRMVERLGAIQPSPGSLQELAQLYGELNRPIEQRRVLRQLASLPRPDPAHFIELAKLEKAAGNPAAGIEMIRRLETFRPGAVDASVVALDLSMRIDAGQMKGALEHAQRWLIKSRSPARDVLPVASAFSVSGYPDIALRFLAPLANKSHEPTLVMATAQAEIDSGQHDAALRRLEDYAADAKDKAHADAAQLRLRLATSMGLHMRAADAAELMGVASIPADLLAATATAALRARRSTVVGSIRARLRDERNTLAAIVMAETSAALQDRQAAVEWADLAATDAIGNPETAVRLAALELNLVRRSLALTALRSGLPFNFQDNQRPVFTGGRAVPENLLEPIARLYVDLRLPDEGQAVLESLKDKQPSLHADQAWVFATAAARRQNAVIEWLKTNEDRRIDPDFLKDLVFIAIKSRSHGIALAASSRLVQDRGTDSDRMLLAEVRVLFGAPLVRLKPSDTVATAGPLDRPITR